jgi:hypothetical protein
MIIQLQRFVVEIEGLFLTGLMSLGVGSIVTSLKIKHIVSVVSYLDREIRKKLDMLHLLLMIGQVGIKSGENFLYDTTCKYDSLYDTQNFFLP